MYSKGQGVEQDHAEAMKWYRLAAEQGNADRAGQSRHAGYAQWPKGVAQNYKEAYIWHSIAAGNGH